MIDYSFYLDALAKALLKDYKKRWLHDEQSETQNHIEEYVMGNSDYNRLADYVETDLKKKLKKYPLKERLRLGVTVSPSTIERILNGTYKVTFVKGTTLHSETAKVLNKLSIYLGYHNWFNFTSIKQSDIADTSLKTHLVNFIREAALARYNHLEKRSDEAYKKTDYYYYNTDGINGNASYFIWDENYYLMKEGYLLAFQDIDIVVEEPMILTDNAAVFKSRETFKVYMGKNKLPTRPKSMAVNYVYILQYAKERWAISEKLIDHLHYTSIFLPSYFEKNLWKQFVEKGY